MFAVLCIVLFSGPVAALAADAPIAGSASSKAAPPAGKSAVNAAVKPVSKPPAAAAPGTRSGAPATTAPTGKPASKAGAKPAAKAPVAATGAKTAAKSSTRPKPRPLAAFVPRVEATLRHGCIDAHEIRSTAARMGLAASEVEGLLTALPGLSAASERACVDYALAQLPAGIGSTMAFLDPHSEKDRLSTTVIHSRPNGSVESTRELLSTEGWRSLVVPVQDLLSNGADSLRGLTYNLQWEIGLLVRHMTAGIASPAAHRLRIVLQNVPAEQYEKIVALELIEDGSGRVVDSVVWLDRRGDVGAYFNMRGENYERLFWESPVDFSRITRGIGRSAVTVRRRLAVKASGKKAARFVSRSFRVRGHHVGIDFAAPIGEPVRAVADAEVVFAGVRGGYGNLVVLEHGSNYQTYYAHLSRFADGLGVGQKILRGEEVGFVGMTGMTTGPHLHFEIRKDNQYFDPLAKQNNLGLWNLYPEEHARLLARIVALDVTRPADRLTQAPLPALN